MCFNGVEIWVKQWVIYLGLKRRKGVCHAYISLDVIGHLFFQKCLFYRLVYLILKSFKFVQRVGSLVVSYKCNEQFWIPKGFVTNGSTSQRRIIGKSSQLISMSLPKSHLFSPLFHIGVELQWDSKFHCLMSK